MARRRLSASITLLAGMFAWLSTAAASAATTAAALPPHQPSPARLTHAYDNVTEATARLRRLERTVAALAAALTRVAVAEADLRARLEAERAQRDLLMTQLLADRNGRWHHGRHEPWATALLRAAARLPAGLLAELSALEMRRRELVKARNWAESASHRLRAQLAEDASRYGIGAWSDTGVAGRATAGAALGASALAGAEVVARAIEPIVPYAGAVAVTAGDGQPTADPTKGAPSWRRRADADLPRLGAPVEGMVLSAYGEGNSGALSRGVTIAVAHAAPVRAPRGGRIVFAAPFRDFGPVLIIDHGDGYHTLIAGASRIDVAAGAQVRTGDRIGVVVPADGKHGRLYVELWRHGEPVDPLPWLASAHNGVAGSG